MNLLLLLTALLTSLTGMIAGERTSARVPAMAVAAERTAEIAEAAVEVAAVQVASSPPVLRATRIIALPLPRAFALVPAIRLAAEKRRE